jgi:hypothetical protein
MKITHTEIEKGYKRINICLNIPTAEKLLELCRLKGDMKHTTVATMYLIDAIKTDHKKNLPEINKLDQLNMFSKKKKNAVR